MSATGLESKLGKQRQTLPSPRGGSLVAEIGGLHVNIHFAPHSPSSAFWAPHKILTQSPEDLKKRSITNSPTIAKLLLDFY